MSKALEIARALVKVLEKSENNTELADLKPGEKFRTEIGNFIVLDHENGQTKVLQEKFYAEGIELDSDSCDYIKSDLKRLFDSKITEKYEEIFGDALVEHEIHLMSVDMQEYGTFKCKVRPMIFDEARLYNEFIVDKALPGLWWTCTPWSTKERGWERSVAVVYPSGDVGRDDCGFSRGVRPFCILKSNIFVSKED